MHGTKKIEVSAPSTRQRSIIVTKDTGLHTTYEELVDTRLGQHFASSAIVKLVSNTERFIHWST